MRAVTLWQLDPEVLARAAASLEALHPVETAELRELFRRHGADFDAFWREGPATWERDLIARDRAVVAAVLRAAAVAISGRRKWTFGRGIATAVHAVVGVDPARLHGLYRVSGGPPASATRDDARAIVVESTHDSMFELLLPERFEAEAGASGLQGAWSPASVRELLTLAGSVGSRTDVDARIAARERSLWGRISGDAARARAIRAELDAGAWDEWTRIVEALRVTSEAGHALGFVAT